MEPRNVFKDRFPNLHRIRVPIPNQYLYPLLLGRLVMEATDLPEDAKYLASYYDVLSDSTVLIYEHPDFEATPPGGTYPELPITWRIVG